MKEKILKLITVIAVIITLTSINVLFTGYHIVVALASELETQGNNTNIADVKFNAYFKGENGNTHYKQANISDEQVYLYLNINVLEKGSVDNAIIRINDSNFKMTDSSNPSEYVKNINLDTNEIELNSIIYNNNVEIEIPIEFNKVDNINEEYFLKETNITIEGTYKEEEEQETLQGNIVTKVEWTDNSEVNMFQSIEKCIDLGEDGVLIEQQIATTVENGNLPREVEQFAVTVPRIGNVLPTNIEVLVAGTKLNDNNVQYNEETGILNITRPIVVNGEGNVSWDSDLEEYKVIYMYDQSVKENSPNITIHTEMNSKLFTKGNSTKTDEQQITLTFHGNVVSNEKTVTQELYKGYLYANSANETTYRENNVIEISNAEITDSIQATTSQSYFVDDNGNGYDANGIVTYKETIINKNRFMSLFGNDGYILIKDGNGNVINTINSQSQTDESGNIHITYGETQTGIIFETSKPVEEGQFTIHNIKVIQSNTGYSKNQLKGFTRFITNELISTNLGTDTTEANINLLDTTTEATLEMNCTNLSTLQMNENVQLTVTLKTSSPKYDLFKNPVFQVVLPSGISNIYVNSVSKVYADDFEIVYGRIVDGENGQKIVQIALSGEQSDYSNEVNELAVVIDANVEFSVLTPSQASSLTMTYTNENGNEDTYQTALDVTVQSKPGMMIYNNLSGFNTAGDSIYTIDENIPVGVLEVESEAITARANTAVINNYDIEVKNAVIIGRIPKKSVYGGTIDTTLVNGIRTNLTDVEILYSTEKDATPDDSTWTTDYTNAASYMVRIDSMAAGQSVAIQYEFLIPEKVGYGKSIYLQTDATYTYLGNENTQTSRIGARSENAITNNVETLGSAIQTQQGGLGIARSAVTGGTELEDGVAVYEGQVITYLTQITNNTGSDLHNISAVATQTNGNIYGLLEEETYDPNEDELTVLNYHRYEELNTNIHNFETIETLANGESAILEYSVVAVETEDSSAQTSGNIVITADGLSDTTINTITNPIQQAELKAFMKSAFYEEEKLYFGQNVHMNLEISNISGQALKTVKGTIQLPEGTYLESTEDLIWGTTTIGGEEIIYSGEKIINTSYDQQSNVITFEINGMDIGEYTVLELYFQIAEYDEIEKDFPFYYQLEAGNVYTSNIAHLRSLNTKRNVFAEQTANIEDGTQLRNGDNIEITTRVENNSEQELHFIFSDALPDGFTGLGGRIISANGEIEIPVVEETPEKNQPVICDNFFSGEVDIPAGESIEVILSIRMDTEFITEEIVTNTMKIAYGELNQDQNSVYQLEWEDGIDCSKEYNIMLLRDEENYEWLRVEQIGNPENNSKILDGQEIKYTFSIRNMQNFDINVALYDSIPTGMIVTSIVLDGNVLDGENVAVEEYIIGAGQTSILEISGYAYLGRLSERELSNYLIVETSRKDYESNNIVYTLLKEIIEEPVTEEPGEEDIEGVDPVTEEPGITDPGTEDPGTEDPGTEDPGTEDPGTEDPGTEDPGTEDPGTEDPGTEDPGTEDPGTEDPGTEDPGTDTPVEVGKYTISGIAWVDSNRDGRRDSSESVLSGINVRVLDINTGSYVSNVSATTGSNGYYELSVEQGNYIVIFEYDTNRYTLTEYRKAGVDETQNSDAISRNLTVDGVNITVGATDVINVDSTNIENIDIGLAEAQIFDLELDKYVSEIVLQTSKSTTQYGYNDQSLVKVEIPSREINNATVIIKYTIKVRNTGELAGYVQNITDYMPSDLNFSSELNSDWYLANSKLQNNSLSNKAIQPGETQTVDLVLVKSVNGDNTGTIINIAEIAQASNNLEISDADSTPGNNNASEDDYGRAEVIISVGTGRLIIFISIIFAILALSGVSVYVINKKVLNKDEFNF